MFVKLLSSFGTTDVTLRTGSLSIGCKRRASASGRAATLEKTIRISSRFYALLSPRVRGKGVLHFWISTEH